MAQSQLRGNKQIRSGSITNTEIASDANIALSKIQSGNTISGYDGRVTSLENDAFVTREVPNGLINGSNVTFTLDNTPVSGSEQVYLNGLLQDPGAGNSYTISGSTITFLSAPLTNDEIHVSYKTQNYTTDPNSASAPAVSVNYGTLLSGDYTFTGADKSSAMIRSDGVLLTIGANNYGQLGLGDTVDRYTPRRVGSDTNWSKISANKWRGSAVRVIDFHIALKNNGTLWSWGRNDLGQLGLGDTTQRTSPVQIGVVTTWSKIAVGNANVSAIRTDGTLWSWGYNADGRLGDSSTTQRNSPVQIGSATNWSEISAGGNHTVAIKTNGTLWAWGNNSQYQLGDGTTTQRTSPVQIGSATNWTKVACGGGATNLALRSDGTLWSWGYGLYGALGHGNTADKTTPTQIGSATNWSKIFSTEYCSFAIKTDGTLWAWGYNDYWMLGDGTSTQRNSPVQIGTDTDWSEVRGGRFHTLASKTDGTLHALGGENTHGQLGDATNRNRYGPGKSEVDLNS